MAYNLFESEEQNFLKKFESLALQASTAFKTFYKQMIIHSVVSKVLDSLPSNIPSVMCLFLDVLKVAHGTWT